MCFGQPSADQRDLRTQHVGNCNIGPYERPSLAERSKRAWAFTPLCLMQSALSTSDTVVRQEPCPNVPFISAVAPLLAVDVLLPEHRPSSLGAIPISLKTSTCRKPKGLRFFFGAKNWLGCRWSQMHEGPGQMHAPRRRVANRERPGKSTASRRRPCSRALALIAGPTRATSAVDK